jgi:hypothetical protein
MGSADDVGQTGTEAFDTEIGSGGEDGDEGKVGAVAIEMGCSLEGQLQKEKQIARALNAESGKLEAEDTEEDDDGDTGDMEVDIEFAPETTNRRNKCVTVVLPRKIMQREEITTVAD